jgi:ArsR family transcriptional regulator, arsenate/arsenite/antimonite-responsive transcriptional repressor
VKDALEAFKAAGESTRFRALRALIDAGVDLCACEIIDTLQKPQYTISKSLGILVAAGLVDERREGRMMMYSLVHNSINESILAAVASVPRLGDAELSGDHERLIARLEQRTEGSCVAGC